jgi:hypothetical protein
MSYITYSGYGYSKRLCEDIATWFLNRVFPRHKISVDIVHRGLKRECVYGYCDVIGSTYYPRHFLIELDTYMNEELYAQTLLHELVHLQQWVHGALRIRYGKLCYSKEPVEKYEYEYQPHEIEAREQEETLYLEYLTEKNCVPVREVVQFFPNRLLQAV